LQRFQQQLEATEAQDRLRDLILQAYTEYETENAVAS